MSSGPLPGEPSKLEAARRRQLSPAEQRIWVLEQLQPGVGHNRAAVLDLRGRLDRRALQRALDGLVARHAALRTVFVGSGEGPRAAVLPAEPVELGEGEQGSSLEDLVELATGRPFDLASAPLLRAVLGRTGRDRHVLFLVTHSLGCDEAAQPLLIRDLCAQYGGLPLPDTLQYERLVEEQLARLDSDGYEEELRFWRARLAHVPALLDVPSDRPRPLLQSYRGGRVRGELPDPAAVGIERRVAVVAAFAAVLRRWTGQTDLVLGLGDGLAARAVGPVAGVLVLRLDLGSAPSFEELLATVDDRAAEARAHAMPFERLVEELNPERDLSRSPIFQAHVAVEDEALMAADMGEVSAVVLDPEPPSGRFDLALHVSPVGTGLAARLDYAADLFERESAERLLGHVRTLLQAALEDPSRSIERLPLLGHDECRDLLIDWNATAAVYPREAMLDELVSARAQATPDAVAVDGEDATLTYAELDHRSSQLAHHLLALGAEAGDVVGVCVERSAAMIVALLGVLKTGAAYVPVDPTYPPERQAFMLEDVQASLLVTDERSLENLPETAAELVVLERLKGQLERLPDSAPHVTVAADDLAYVTYTSGSTGRPKGVEIRHRSVVNLIEHMRRAPGLDAQDIVVNLTTFAFDLSVPDLYLPLVCGARLVVLPREATLDGRELARRLERAGVTFVQATPTTWQMLVEAGWKGSDRLRIVCGGEALSRPLAEELLRRGESVWHMYGPTETTVWSSIRRLEPGSGPPPLGGPIANTRFYVLDDALQLVPSGVPGQLFIGGDGLARGYRGRPELTAERFLPDPFAGGDERIYATGDLVRRHGDGTLEFLGRSDQQVKLHGFRVELGEVEAVLGEHPGVRVAVVVVREDVPGDRRLVAYVAAAEAAPSVSELRAHLVQRLPFHMVPATFVVLDELPETPNRKVDRNALPAPGLQRPELEHGYQPPRTPVEKLVAATWGEVLGLERVGVEDDFFELGGSSLLATRVTSRLQRELGVPVPLRRIFELPTVARLTASIVEAMTEAALAEGDDASALLGDLELEQVSR